MFKLIKKFLLISLLVLGAAFIFHLPSASADAGICGSAPLNPPSGNWGVHSGGGQGDLSGLEVHATADGVGSVNVNYRVYSFDQDGNNKQGIWRWAGDQTGRADLTYHSMKFSTGEDISNGTSTYHCDGWSVFGHGTSDSNGNGYVLNCGSETEPPYRYEITNLPDTVNGTSGKWEEVLIDGAHPGGYTVTNDVNGNPKLAPIATNGGTNQVHLIFHPDTNPENNGVCNNLTVSNPNDDDKATRTGVWASGVPGISNPTNVPDDNGDKDSKSKTWTFRPNANSIDVVVVSQWYKPDDPNKGWHNYTDGNGNVIKYYLKSDGNFAQVTYTHSASGWTEDSHPNITCYSATCSISYVDGDGPQNGYNPDGSPHYIVQAGGPMYIHGTFTNTSPGPTYLTMWAGAYLDGPNGTNALGFVPYSGDPVRFEIDNIRAPAAVQTYNATFTPQYNGSESNMTSCSLSGAYGGNPIPIYQKFNGSVAPTSSLGPTIEHPNRDDYTTSITLQWDNPPAGLPDHDVNINNTHSEFYKLSAGGAKTGIDSNTGGTYKSSTGGYKSYTLNNHYDIPAGSYQAGDEFCAHIKADYTSGWVGPDNNVIDPSNPSDPSPDCDRVVNEPYFKVYHGDISAGGDFNHCTTDGGTLAGYADISDPSGATRGSTTQLSALALLKITGVASAKTSADITGSPTKLTFANAGVQVDSTGNESPTLGGQLGGCRTLTNETAPGTATNYGGSTFDLSGKNGAYAHTGDLTVNGTTLGASQNASVFVDGDAYISSDVTYGDNWQAGTAPSFILHATGNIYIDPGVKQLAGVYIAQEKSDGSEGKIYTCSDASKHFQPMSAVNLYNGCKNQLVVTGNLVAKQVNLMRTFGSLRDEEPTPGSPGGATESIQWSSCGSYGHPVGGESCLPASGQSGLRCTSTPEPSEDSGGGAWADNILCVPSSSGLGLVWTHDSGNSDALTCLLNQKKGTLSTYLAGGWASLNCIQNKGGYQYCTKWDVPPDYYQTWNDNYLCMNKARPDSTPLLHFVNAPTSGESCISISEIADHDGQWPTGYYLCQPSGTPTSPKPKGPPYTGCSNPGLQPDNISCAGELFEYSPTLDLSAPVTNPPGGGSIQFQAISSLPPVL